MFVPGNGTNGDGLEGTQSLVRCKLALKEWLTGQYDLIAPSGGINKPRSIQRFPEGRLEKEWLVAHGVPEVCIVSEERSLDTFQNLRFTLNTLYRHIAGHPELQNRPIELTPVTHPLHVRRIILSTIKSAKLQRELENRRITIIAKNFDHPVGLADQVLGNAFLLITHTDPNGRSKLIKGYRSRLRKKARKK